MIQKAINKFFNIFGLQVTVNKKTNASARFRKNQTISLDALVANPLDSNLHLKLAKQYHNNGDYYAAWAEFKTAQHLGIDQKSIADNQTLIANSLPDPETMNHNQYFRFHTLKHEILRHVEGIDGIPAILDIGGGHGELAAFIRDFDYCLVEPTINGINGLDIPFENESFDLVVSCHVLEHIPVSERDTFLDQLVSKAKKGVILLNPIHIDTTLPKERMQLVIDVTNAAWAKEHMECSLPTIESVKEYADKRNLKFHYRPNGTMTTSLALVFVDYLRNNLDPVQYERINRFFNTRYCDIVDSEEYPNAGLFYLEK